MPEETTNPSPEGNEAKEHEKKVLPPHVHQIELSEYKKQRAQKIEEYQNQKEHKQSAQAKIMRLIGNAFWVLMAVLALVMIGFLVYGFFNLPKE